MRLKPTFWVFGSGRWSKIIVSQLLKLFGGDLNVFIVTNRNAKLVKDEFSQLSMSTVEISHQIKTGLHSKNNYAIVCGKTSSNIANVRAAISAGMDVYVEKPFTLDAEDANQLLTEAEQKNVKIYSSNVFFFHDKLHKLLFEKEPSRTLDNVQKLKFVWIDEANVPTASPKPKFDPRLTGGEDVLPHIIPLACKFLRCSDINIKGLEVERFGQLIRAQFRIGTSDVDVHIERNGEARVRELQYVVGQSTKIIDFSDRMPSMAFLERHEINKESDELGPLALSLYDFVWSGDSLYRNTRESVKTIELFPLFDEMYLKACQKNISTAKSAPSTTIQEVEYLRNELLARQSSEEPKSKYFNETASRKLLEGLSELKYSDQKAGT